MLKNVQTEKLLFKKYSQHAGLGVTIVNGNSHLDIGATCTLVQNCASAMRQYQKTHEKMLTISSNKGNAN
jgi:hypothetical protein